MQGFHGCSLGSPRAFCASKTDHGHAGTGVDNGLEVLKVQVHHAVGCEKFRHARDGTNQEFVTHSKRTGDGQVLDALNFQQSLVGNDKNGVAMLPQPLQTPFGVLFSKGTFGFERIGDHSDGHGALGFGQTGDVAGSCP